MFSLLGKKEVIGTTLWLAPMGLSILGYLQWTPYRAVVAMMVSVVILSAVVSTGSIVRFLINYYRGPRIPLG
jgi:hypothetical protein